MTRNAKIFAHSGLVVLALLLVANALIHLGAHRTQHGRMLSRLDSTPLDIECLVLGNSLVEAGCDVKTFEANWPGQEPHVKTLNLALGGTSPLEHYLILRQAYRRPIHPRLIIYGFMDDQLSSKVETDWHSLTGNRALSSYFPAEAAALMDPASRLKTWQLEIVSHIPMLAERSSLWAKVERLRRELGALGLQHKKEDRFGRAEDFARLEAGDSKSFRIRCRGIVDGKRSFSPAIEALIKLAHEHGASVVLVEMPLPIQHQRLFYSAAEWSRLQQWNETLAEQHQATYISAADWVQTEDAFDDSLHMNQKGARCFSARLAQEISTGQSRPPPFGQRKK